MTLRSILATTLLTISTMMAHAEETIHAQVDSAWITLGDVAQASGPLAKVRVAPSPEPGETLALDPAFVGKIARENGVYFPADRSEPIRIARLGTAPQSHKPTFQQVIPKPPSNEHVLVLAEDLSRGDVITLAHLEWLEPGTIRKPATHAPENMEAVLGLEARRTMRAGRAIRIADVQAVSVIKKGEPVTLTYAKGGLRLSVTGRALTNAAMGEPVRIMNNYSNRALDAVATGAGRAQVSEL